MDKAKLIEKIKEAMWTVVSHDGKEAKVKLNGAELDLILTSLTAPVPDGKECLHLIAYVDDDNFQRCQTCDKIID